jgi:hypothetical protein
MFIQQLRELGEPIRFRAGGLHHVDQAVDHQVPCLSGPGLAHSGWDDRCELRLGLHVSKGDRDMVGSVKLSPFRSNAIDCPTMNQAR